MKENTNIDINTIKTLYRKYKEHLIYILVIFITVVLFLFSVLPRITDLAKLNSDRKIELDKFSILKNNLDLLSNLDDSLLSSQLLLVSSALPSEKDFEGVLNSISLATAKSGASLSDYEFQVGGLSQGLSVKTTGFPFLTLAVSIRGTPLQVAKFIGYLSKSAPLSQVTSIMQNSNSATVAINFYYKALAPSQFNDSSTITPISEKGKQIIKTLSSWGINNLPGQETPVPSTSSANPHTSSVNPF